MDLSAASGKYVNSLLYPSRIEAKSRSGDRPGEQCNGDMRNRVADLTVRTIVALRQPQGVL